MLIIGTLACNVSVNVGPTAVNTPAPVEPSTVTPEDILAPTPTVPAAATASPSSAPGTLVTIGRLTLDIPAGVASGASGSEVAPLTREDAPVWEKTPGHWVISLSDTYVLQGKFHSPQIYLYPALEYATLVPGAFESMHRLRNLLSGVVPLTPDQLPTVPFFNAAQVFASNIRLISFQNGSGIRFVTEYAQYPAPVNNHELFYHFQGFTDDGNTYVLAVFPLTAPRLAESSAVDTPLPVGGIAYPDLNDPNPNFQSYYTAITDLLNGTPPEAFTPTLHQLDALIQSMWVAP
ncbi:MAG: hypothetical protein N3A60_08445 [Thermanaerothrix sp.]|nr:hypothetical protein [Thermanaerothrix sp.]